MVVGWTDPEGSRSSIGALSSKNQEMPTPSASPSATRFLTEGDDNPRSIGLMSPIDKPVLVASS